MLFLIMKLSIICFIIKNNKKVYLLSPSLKNTPTDDCRFWSVQATFGEQMIYCIDALWLL